jgi:hypothetical protein
MASTVIVLRSEAGSDFPGVYTLDGATVVRTGALFGNFREVFVPQGFAVYMHSDYLEYSPSDGTARVTGDRVNMRLLPSSEGLLPIGQLSAGSGPLVVLDQAGEWLRVLAPAVVPLFAPDNVVQPVTDPEAAATWTRLLETRTQRVQAAAAKWREQDPETQVQDNLLIRAEQLADVDVTTLGPEALDARRDELGAIAANAREPQTLSIVSGLQAELEQLAQLRAQAASATETVVRQLEVADEQTLRRESRMLALGLSFRGKGDPLTCQGSVHREGLGESPIYTLHTTEGEILKLTAPPQVATFEALVGKKITVDGRRLLLMVVDGPVLVIDKLVSYTPR